MRAKKDHFTEEEIGEMIQRKPVVLKRVGLSDPAVWRLERDGKFPKRFRLGTHSVGWLKSEIDGWIALQSSNRLQVAPVPQKAQG